MDLSSILHRSLSEMAYSPAPGHFAFRLRAKAGDLKEAYFLYGDTAYPAPVVKMERAKMEMTVSTSLYDYFEAEVSTPLVRLVYAFELLFRDGGRLYYMENGKRVYFMEEAFGEKGNLMPRDVVSKYIYDAPGQVYLDIAFLEKQKILENLREVYDLCLQYLGLDVTMESIPVAPSVHFFMGGLAVDARHRTNLRNLYAVGECASMYHGANRLGGNSLLAAVYSGRAAARDIAEADLAACKTDFTGYIRAQREALCARTATKSRFSAVYIQNDLAKIMNDDLGIVRTEEKLRDGIRNLQYYLSIVDKLKYDSEISPYQAYSLRPMLCLGLAVLTCAEARRETRGAHIRTDFPQRAEAFAACTLIDYANGAMHVSYGNEDALCL